MSESEKTQVTNRRLRKMLRIWLPLQDVGEFRNIDKRKTNVKTELMIEGGYENFHLH